jgi:hypothetical protein
MRQATLRRILALMAFGVLLTTGVLHVAVPARADELSYLQLLNMRGMVVTDTAQALRTGWALCDALDYNNGVAVAEAFYQITDYSVPNRSVAALWVTSAVEGLCPWHDHRGGYVA